MDSNKKHKISGGLYLVLDPSIDQSVLISKLKSALEGGINVLQVWNNWPNHFVKSDKIELINKIVDNAQPYNVPVLINEEWELVKESESAGVHFDIVPGNYNDLRNGMLKDKIIGLTCGNDTETVKWGEENAVDYISFCALFPSKSAGVCEIVTQESIIEARKLTKIPFFVSGGITSENLMQLNEVGIQGAAVISGILDSESPKDKSQEYIKTLNQIIK